MSSMAKMFDGSAIATISVEPARFTGITVCLIATSSGISWITSGSISNSSRSIDGTPYCLATNSVSSFSCRKPSLVICAPRRAPFAARFVAGALELLARQQVLLDEQLADPLVHRVPFFAMTVSALAERQGPTRQNRFARPAWPCGMRFRETPGIPDGYRRSSGGT